MEGGIYFLGVICGILVSIVVAGTGYDDISYDETLIGVELCQGNGGLDTVGYMALAANDDYRVVCSNEAVFMLSYIEMDSKVTELSRGI